MNIITGRFKGRRLESVDSLSTRPTLARVKESLFCMLDGAIEGKTCLDLFAGSGALGIEAISRGAKKVVFVEVRHPHVTNSMQVMFDELANNYDYNIHTHFLLTNGTIRADFRKRCLDVCQVR